MTIYISLCFLHAVDCSLVGNVARYLSSRSEICEVPDRYCAIDNCSGMNKRAFHIF
jgi:hypothetical protein